MDGSYLNQKKLSPSCFSFIDLHGGHASAAHELMLNLAEITENSPR